MTSILGPYTSFWHWRGEDEEYLRRLDPAWSNIHQPNARAIWTVQRNAPNSKVMLRSWDIDDSNFERHREMYADPIGAARKHMDLWAAKLVDLSADLDRNGDGYTNLEEYLNWLAEPQGRFMEYYPAGKFGISGADAPRVFFD